MGRFDDDLRRALRDRPEAKERRLELGDDELVVRGREFRSDPPLRARQMRLKPTGLSVPDAHDAVGVIARSDELAVSVEVDVRRHGRHDPGLRRAGVPRPCRASSPALTTRSLVRPNPMSYTRERCPLRTATSAAGDVPHTCHPVIATGGEAAAIGAERDCDQLSSLTVDARLVLTAPHPHELVVPDRDDPRPVRAERDVVLGIRALMEHLGRTACGLPKPHAAVGPGADHTATVRADVDPVSHGLAVAEQALCRAAAV